MAIKAKALSLFKNLKKGGSHEASTEFTASTAWFSKLKNQPQLCNIKKNC
jgi:hypothetical protein